MAAQKKYTVQSKVWIYPGDVGWHFVNVDKKLAAELKEKYATKTKGFGSIPVKVTIGKTTWKTSLFPEKRSGTYLLPLKAPVRRAEDISEGDTVEFTIAIQISPK